MAHKKTTGITNEDERILTMIQTGAAWTNVLLFKTGEVASELCTFCKQRHTLEHILWECPAHDQTRMNTDPGLAALAKIVKKLPTAIRYGVAPAMDGLEKCTFWGQPLDDLGEHKELLGGYLFNRSKEYLREASAYCRNLGNYRQIFQHLKKAAGEMKPEEFPLPETVVGEYLEQPNIYTDASLHRDGDVMYTAAGAAAWHPGRANLENESDMEKDCHHAYEPDGIGHYLPVYGQRTSSTRAELAAAIIGISRPIPVHVATDSQAFLNKADQLIRKAKDALIVENTIHLDTQAAKQAALMHRPLRRNWTAMADGDLWHVFWRYCVSKGPETIKLSKVKAHTVGADIDLGIINAVDQAGNDKADTQARAAPNAKHKWVLALTVYTQTRLTKYTELMRRIQKFIVEVYKRERDRIALERRVGGPDGDINLMRAVDHERGGGWRNLDHDLRHREQLCMEIDREELSHDKKGTVDEHMVADFLETLDVTMANEDEHAITWLELAAAFEHDKGEVCEHTMQQRETIKAACLKPRWKVIKVVQTVKSVARAIARKTENHILTEALKPRLNVKQPLRQLAIQGSYASTNLIPRRSKLGGVDGKEMSKMLLLARGTRIAKQGSTYFLRIAKVKHGRIPPWRPLAIKAREAAAAAQVKETPEGRRKWIEESIKAYRKLTPAQRRRADRKSWEKEANERNRDRTCILKLIRSDKHKYVPLRRLKKKTRPRDVQYKCPWDELPADLKHDRDHGWLRDQSSTDRKPGPTRSRDVSGGQSGFGPPHPFAKGTNSSRPKGVAAEGQQTGKAAIGGHREGAPCGQNDAAPCPDPQVDTRGIGTKVPMQELEAIAAALTCDHGCSSALFCSQCRECIGLPTHFGPGEPDKGRDEHHDLRGQVKPEVAGGTCIHTAEPKGLKRVFRELAEQMQDTCQHLGVDTSTQPKVHKPNALDEPDGQEHQSMQTVVQWKAERVFTKYTLPELDKLRATGRDSDPEDDDSEVDRLGEAMPYDLEEACPTDEQIKAARQPDTDEEDLQDWEKPNWKQLMAEDERRRKQMLKESKTESSETFVIEDHSHAQLDSEEIRQKQARPRQTTNGEDTEDLELQELGKRIRRCGVDGPGQEAVQDETLRGKPYGTMLDGDNVTPEPEPPSHTNGRGRRGSVSSTDVISAEVVNPLEDDQYIADEKVSELHRDGIGEAQATMHQSPKYLTSTACQANSSSLGTPGLTSKDVINEDVEQEGVEARKGVRVAKDSPAPESQQEMHAKDKHDMEHSEERTYLLRTDLEYDEDAKLWEELQILEQTSKEHTIKALSDDDSEDTDEKQAAAQADKHHRLGNETEQAEENGATTTDRRAPTGEEVRQPDETYSEFEIHEGNSTHGTGNGTEGYIADKGVDDTVDRDRTSMCADLEHQEHRHLHSSAVPPVYHGYSAGGRQHRDGPPFTSQLSGDQPGFCEEHERPKASQAPARGAPISRPIDPRMIHIFDPVAAKNTHDVSHDAKRRKDGHDNDDDEGPLENPKRYRKGTRKRPAAMQPAGGQATPGDHASHAESAVIPTSGQVNNAWARETSRSHTRGEEYGHATTAHDDGTLRGASDVVGPNLQPELNKDTDASATTNMVHGHAMPTGEQRMYDAMEALRTILHGSDQHYWQCRHRIRDLAALLLDQWLMDTETRPPERHLHMILELSEDPCGSNCIANAQEPVDMTGAQALQAIAVIWDAARTTSTRDQRTARPLIATIQTGDLTTYTVAELVQELVRLLGPFYTPRSHSEYDPVLVAADIRLGIKEYPTAFHGQLSPKHRSALWAVLCDPNTVLGTGVHSPSLTTNLRETYNFLTALAFSHMVHANEKPKRLRMAQGEGQSPET